MLNKISVIGGDLRLVTLVEMLKKDGIFVYTYGLEKAENNFGIVCNTLEEAIKNSEIVIAPIPLSSNGETINAPFSKNEILIKDIIKNLEDKTFIAGAIRQDTLKSLEEKNIQVIDMLKREELAVLNAISTAEGAIQIAIEQTARTLHRSNVLVMGFGRIGKILSHMLQGIGANVSCEARKPADLAWIKAYGYNPIHLNNLDEHLNEFDIIINTIPFVVLNETNLGKVKKDCLLIDLASNPGGIDKKEVKKQNLKFVWALSIPGKVAPVTSAEYIKDTLYNIFKEM